MKIKMVNIMILILNLIIIDFIYAEMENSPSTEQETKDVFDLGRIVITPSRLYQEYGQVSRATNLITEEEIQDKNPRRVGDLLKDLPSAQVMEYGSLGHSSSIRFRGATSSQTLVLIDDMPLNNPRDGEVNLSDYETENIDRIEVVRGPSSSLYGSSAVGGIVNIITKEGRTEQPQTAITSRLGTYRTHIHEVTNGAKIGGFNYFLSASSANSEGHRDNSEYQGESYDGKAGYDFGDKHQIRFSGRYHRSELGTPGSTGSFDEDDKQEEHQNYVNGIWESNFNNKFRLKLQGYTNLDRLEFIETVYPDLDKDTHQTKNRSVSLQGSYTLLENYTLLAGAEGKKHLLNSSVSGKYDYIVRSTYGLLDLHLFDRLDVVGGARIDDYTTFGSQVSPNINCALKFDPWKIRGMFAESYRAPTFNDLYWPDEGWAKGNPNLSPEKGKTYEVGIDNVMDFLIFKKFPLDTKAGITYFHTEMKNLINWAEDAADGYWKPSNVSKARIEGLEIEGEAVVIKDIKTVFSYTLTKAKDKDTKRYLNYRPKHKFDFSVQYSHPWGIIGCFRSEYNSSCFVDEPNNVQVKPYWVFGTDLYYDLNENIRYFVNIDNIFNRTYEKAKGYPMPGFSIMSGIRAKF